MKTVEFRFSGAPSAGDLIMLSYSGSRGGRSTAKYRVKLEADQHGQAVVLDDLKSVVDHLATVINGNGPDSEWCPGTGDFKAVARGTTLMVMFSELVSDITFHADIEGSQTMVIEIEVFG